jgi:hypothetical protein
MDQHVHDGNENNQILHNSEVNIMEILKDTEELDIFNTEVI